MHKISNYKNNKLLITLFLEIIQISFTRRKIKLYAYGLFKYIQLKSLNIVADYYLSNYNYNYY